MGAKMEVLPNSLLKRRGSSTATWGGGTLGRVGGRRRRRRYIRSTIFTISFFNLTVPWCSFSTDRNLKRELKPAQRKNIPIER